MFRKKNKWKKLRPEIAQKYEKKLKKVSRVLHWPRSREYFCELKCFETIYHDIEKLTSKIQMFE